MELLNKAIARRYERLLVRDGEPKYNKRLTPSTTLPATPSTAAFKTTQEAAQLLNTNYEALRKFLQRFSEHRPARQLGRTWVWTLEEIENMRNLL
ncbi:hypothetical protein [Kocuria rosea]|uniref:hypothetical protein n=1 Tax=Kocuria rosea TaxID=1275 RepID=UPI0025417721|nr:hypothetical protein [Kocuria rosea]WIG18379.1 hypothetical protein QOY29_05475 [Kocuria rosea]